MNQNPAQRSGKWTGAMLALSYGVAMPWLVWKEAVDLVPIVCALVFGYFWSGPVTTAFQRAPRSVRWGLAVLVLAAIGALILAARGGRGWASLGEMPLWIANHLFFLFFASLVLLKGVVAWLLQAVGARK